MVTEPSLDLHPQRYNCEAAINILLKNGITVKTHSLKTHCADMFLVIFNSLTLQCFYKHKYIFNSLYWQKCTQN